MRATSPLARNAREAARRQMRQDLLAALEEHRGDLDAVATDPRVGCTRTNLYRFARQAGLNLRTLAAGYRKGRHETPDRRVAVRAV